ncbi:hypothetical protein HK097_010864, partial [Rhizophlyctis rosea]
MSLDDEPDTDSFSQFVNVGGVGGVGMGGLDGLGSSGLGSMAMGMGMGMGVGSSAGLGAYDTMQMDRLEDVDVDMEMDMNWDEAFPSTSATSLPDVTALVAPMTSALGDATNEVDVLPTLTSLPSSLPSLLTLPATHTTETILRTASSHLPSHVPDVPTSYQEEPTISPRNDVTLSDASPLREGLDEEEDALALGRSHVVGDGGTGGEDDGGDGQLDLERQEGEQSPFGEDLAPIDDNPDDPPTTVTNAPEEDVTEFVTEPSGELVVDSPGEGVGGDANTPEATKEETAEKVGSLDNAEEVKEEEEEMGTVLAGGEGEQTLEEDQRSALLERSVSLVHENSVDPPEVEAEAEAEAEEGEAGVQVEQIGQQQDGRIENDVEAPPAEPDTSLHPQLENVAQSLPSPDAQPGLDEPPESEVESEEVESEEVESEEASGSVEVSHDGPQDDTQHDTESENGDDDLGGAMDEEVSMEPEKQGSQAGWNGVNGFTEMA